MSVKTPDATSRPSAESLLAKLGESERARLRIYVGAAPGVGKTYEMLQDAHILRKQGYDTVIGFVETYGRAETEAKIADLEIIPRKKIGYRGVVLEEIDVDAIVARKPQVCRVDELAHSNVPGSKNRKRYEDVLDILEAEQVLDGNRRTAAYLNRRVEDLRSHPRVAHFRNTGMIWAFDVRGAEPDFAQRFYERAIEAGLLLRPLGNTVYWMPPYVIGEGEIDFLVGTLTENLDAWFD